MQDKKPAAGAPEEDPTRVTGEDTTNGTSDAEDSLDVSAASEAEPAAEVVPPSEPVVSRLHNNTMAPPRQGPWDS